MKSIAMEMFLESFKTAAADGAVVELKLRLLAGKIPKLQKYAHQKRLEDIEDEIAKHFGDALSAQDKEILGLCRQLRNKVLHTDFRAARDKLNELGVETQSGGVTKIDLPLPSMTQVSRKIQEAQARTGGILVADTSSTDLGGVFGWFLESGQASDFQKASEAFKKATAIIDRLSLENNNH